MDGPRELLTDQGIIMFGKKKAIGSGLASAAAIYQKGIAAFETGRYSEAIELLASIAEQSSLPATLAKFYLGQAHMKQGIRELNAKSFAPAARHFAEARRINPNSEGLSKYIIACHVGQGRFDMAADELEKTPGDQRRDPAIPIRLAHAFLRDGQQDRAIETLVGAIDLAPRRADLRLQLGLIQASAGEYEAATKSLKAAERLSPFDPSVQLHLGMAYGARQMAEEAVRHLRSAQRLKPHDAHIAQLLAMAMQSCPVETAGEIAFVGASENRNALDQLGDVITHDPEFVEAFLNLPASDVDGEIFAMLAGTLERALERHADYADLHYHCSRVYRRLGKTQEAIAFAQQAVQINPRYVQALIQLGRLYAETNESGPAMERLIAAIESGGDYPDVHYLLGELYRQSGRREEACAAYRRALTLNGEFKSAREALELVAAAEGGA